MGFNYGLEKKKFDAEWDRHRKEYADAGMDASAIEEMYQFDLCAFRRRRNASIHEQSLTGFQTSDKGSVTEDRSPLIMKFSEEVTVNDTYTFCEKRFAWIDTVSNEDLYIKLLQLPEDDKELLTLLIVDELTKREIATLRGVTEQAVGQKIKRLKFLLSGV